jgi:hypothetical protein
MYVARDENGGVYLYKKVPQRGSTVWVGGEKCMAISSHSLPKSINPKWEDPEPIEVKLVRKNK